VRVSESLICHQESCWVVPLTILAIAYDYFITGTGSLLSNMSLMELLFGALRMEAKIMNPGSAK